MINFSLTNEQKRQALESTLTGLEMSIYNLILSIGEDPDTYDQSLISTLSEREAPSNEYRLFTLYNRYNLIKEKISNL
jgi:hypothetical protein